MTPIAISMGDPAGIGPEICARLFAPGAAVLPRCVVVGDAGALFRAAAPLGLAVLAIDGPEAASFAPEVIEVIQAGPALPDDLPFGRVDARAGRAAHEAVVAAATLARAGRVRAIVTAPLHKEALHAAGVPHPGHTEILAELAGGADVRMMLFNDDLRVVLATIHAPLSAVPAMLSLPGELRTIRLAAEACRRLGVAAPRVAVAGLNPHAGEGGLFGREEIAVIQPAIERARSEGIDASGPWPGDTVFMHARAGRFDIVVAQYHDQGLIPVKYLGLDRGVNVTLGLDFVRTSVDHGTAFDIAGQGVADPSSLIEAVRQADRLAGAG